MQVVVATVSTAHFDFEAVGATEEEARHNLLGGWWRHTRQYRDADLDLMNRLLADGEVRFKTYWGGVTATRDGEPL